MLVNHLPATKVEGNQLLPELYERLTSVLQTLKAQKYSEIGQKPSCSVLDDVQVVEKLSDLDRQMLDFTRD